MLLQKVQWLELTPHIIVRIIGRLRSFFMQIYQAPHQSGLSLRIVMNRRAGTSRRRETRPGFFCMDDVFYDPLSLHIAISAYLQGAIVAHWG